MPKSRNDPWTYKKAGVDVNEIRKGHRTISAILKKTKAERIVRGVGHYAGLVDLGDGKLLAIHTDGVGTKVLIAQLMSKFDTIGIDCIAMNVNDIICVGAEPLAFVDYIAMKKMDQSLVEELMKGLVKGAEEADVAIVGGETAVMPDVIDGVDEKAFDIAGTVVGLVKKGQLVDGSKLKVGDIVIGVESNGIHSNGLTLARKVLLQKYRLSEKPPELDNTLGEELLKPTRIYVKPVMEALRKKIKITGLAHITGGAFTKLRRIGDIAGVGFNLKDLPPPPSIFKLIQKEGKITEREMYRTFNMGIGFCVCVPKSFVNDVEATFKSYKIRTYRIGEVVAKKGVFVKGTKVA